MLGEFSEAASQSIVYEHISAMAWAETHHFTSSRWAVHPQEMPLGLAVTLKVTLECCQILKLASDDRIHSSAWPLGNSALITTTETIYRSPLYKQSHN